MDERETDVDGQEPIEQGVVSEILDLEWEMFQDVRGLDGPAPCQQDRGTFEIMRSSQLASWNQEIALSYLDDLRRAAAIGRNLMTEKYARMMESTSPCECRGVGAVDERSAARPRKYPLLSARGRPIRACEDSRFTTSFETYNRGELATYSSRTLRLLEDHYLQLVAGGTNPAEVILAHTMAGYGFASLEQAEAALRAYAERRGDRPA